MATSVINQESIFRALELAIQAEVSRAIDAAVAEVVQKTREAVRSRLGEISCGLFSEYQLERLGQNLTITVKIKDGA